MARSSPLLTFVLLPAVALAQYRPDWTAAKFYEEVNACRTGVVLQAIKQKGAATNQDAEKLRIETISMTPVFEAIAVETCPCAINEIAKDMPYSSYKSTPEKLAGYLRVASCENIENKALKALTEERIRDMRLK